MIRLIDNSDAAWIAALLEENWGSVKVVTRGRIHDASRLPGFIALVDNQRAGLITYRLEGDQCELVTLNSLVEGKGFGTALVEAVRSIAQKEHARRLWLITTNDNISAQQFYLKRGFRLAAVHKDAIAESRKLKPEIPQIGIDGIQIRDEIEFEMTIGG